MAQRPTLKDVAAVAGVATTTVTRVLSKTGYVAEDTRKRVEAAVRKTGYSVNSLARSLKSERSHIIGHLLRSTVPNPFYVRVARGVEDHVQSRGYTALTYNMQVRDEAERRGIETFLGWRADAIIITTPMQSDDVEYVVSRGVPVVQVERPMTLKASRVVVRNRTGALLAMQHLTALGHRRIAYVGPEPPPPSNIFAYVERERFESYVEVMADVGASTEGLISFGEGYRDDVESAQGHGFVAMRELLEMSARPTAIYAANDFLAAGAMQAIYAAGLSIPRDISVVGFDDTLAQYVSPLLTTVRLPARRLGTAAAKLVIDQFERLISKDAQELILDSEFIIRESTGPVPA